MHRILAFLAQVPAPAGFVAGAWCAQQLTDLPSLPGQAASALLGLLVLGFAVALHRRESQLAPSARGAAGSDIRPVSAVAVSGLSAALGLAFMGFAWATWVADRALADRIDSELEGIDLRVVGHIAGLASVTPHGRRFPFLVERCEGAPVRCPLGRVVLTWGDGFGSRLGFAQAWPGTAPPSGPTVAHRAQARGVPDLRPGEQWTLTVRLKRPRAMDNPGTFDAELRMLQEGIIATGYVRPASAHSAPVRHEQFQSSPSLVLERLRHQIRERLSAGFGDRSPEAAGVLIALAMGDQQAIGHRWWEIFNRTGVGHLMSISGLHITMLAALAMGLARRALRLPTGLNRRLLARCPGPWLHWGFGVSVAFVYAGIAGWGIPAQRTCWMLLLTALAVLSGRCRGILAILGLAAAVVTLIDPWAPTAAGFWLSFVAVAAIAVYGSSRRLRSVADDAQALTSPGRAGLGDRLDRLLREAVASQWAATLSLLPLSALFFSSVSLVSPLANAFAIPLVSILITPLVLAYAMMALLMPGLAQGLSVVLIAPTEALLFALEFLSRWPYASWVLPRPDPFVLGLSALGVFMLLRPHPVPMRPAWAFTLLPLFLGGAELPGPGGIRVHALDVGQGSAVLIEANGFRMLFDAGPLWSADSNAGQRIVAPWLRARGVRRIDLLVVSHPDLDHAGGVLDVLRSVKVDAVISSIPSGHPFRIDHPNHRSCRRGDLWRQAAVEIEILHPGDEMPPGAARSPTNARSCVMRLRTTAGSVLLTGDLEARQEHDLVNRYGADRLAADVMIVPHHGSNTSSTEAWLAAVAPRWAVIQSGYRNRFGHPKPKVLDRYERAGIVVFRNDLHGAISIELAQGQSPTITKSRVDRAPYWRLK